MNSSAFGTPRPIPLSESLSLEVTNTIMTPACYNQLGYNKPWATVKDGRKGTHQRGSSRPRTAAIRRRTHSCRNLWDSGDGTTWCHSYEQPTQLAPRRQKRDSTCRAVTAGRTTIGAPSHTCFQSFPDRPRIGRSSCSIETCKRVRTGAAGSSTGNRHFTAPRYGRPTVQLPTVTSPNTRNVYLRGAEASHAVKSDLKIPSFEIELTAVLIGAVAHRHIGDTNRSRVHKS